MIDMHVHAVNPQLPGVKTIPTLLNGPPDSIAEILHGQMQESGTTTLCAMGHLSGSPHDPLGVASTLAIAERLQSLFAIGVADPTRTETDHLQQVESQLRSAKVVALIGYLDYLYHGPDSPGYVPYLELAAQYDKPFIFHTGDNWSTVAKVKFVHPLLIDEVAVEHRQVKFVMAHFGNPWTTDAAEVMYKNENVWADLSGILVGDATYFARMTTTGSVQRIVERVRQAIEYTERFNRFLYATDWPLVSMATYRNFVRQLFDKEHHQSVFQDNAKSLFKL